MYRAVPWLIASALLVSGCQSRPAPTSPTGNRPAPNTLIIDASQGAGGPTVTWSCLAASVETPAFGIFSAALSPCPAARVSTLSSVGGAPLSAPAAPSGLSSTVGGSTVNLFWSAGAGADPAASYMVEAGSAPGLANLANFDTGNSAPALTATGVGSGTYYVRVRSKNAAGVSAPSNETVVVVGGACGAVPNPASGLVAASSGSTVTLVWSAPAGGCPPAAYFIEAGSAPGLSNLANFSTGNAATTFGAGGVGNGTYYVRVRSSSPAGKSAASNEAVLVVGGTPPGGGGCTGAPAGLSATVNGSSVMLAWNASAGSPTSYAIEIGRSPGASDVGVLDIGTAATTFGITLSSGTYYIRVRARNTCGASAASNEVVVTTAGPSPAQPPTAAFTVTPTSAGVGAGQCGVAQDGGSNRVYCRWDASGSTPIPGITSFRWLLGGVDFGLSGQVLQDFQVPCGSFSAAEKIVTLTVTGPGGTHSATRAVTFVKANAC